MMGKQSSMLQLNKELIMSRLLCALTVVNIARSQWDCLETFQSDLRSLLARTILLRKCCHAL